MKNKITVTFFGRYLTLFFNFLIVFVVSKFYGPKIKGNHTLLLTTISLIQFFIGFWGSQGLVFLNLRNNSASWTSILLIVSLTGSFISFLVLYFFSELLKMFALTISLGIVLNTLLIIQQTQRLINSDFYKYNIFYFLTAFFSFLCLLLDVFFFKFLNIQYIQFSWLFSLFVVVLSSSFFSKDKIKISFNFNIWKELKISFLQNSPYQVVEFLQFLMLRLPIYFLIYLHGVEYMGIYSVGLSVLESSWHIARSAGLVVFVNSANRNKDDVVIDQSSLNFLYLVTFLTTFLVVIFYLIPAQWFSAIFGPKFIHTPYTIRYLFPGVIAFSSVIVMESYFLGLKKLKLLQFVYSSVLIINIFLTLLLIPKWRFSAVAFTSSVTYILAAFILFYFFYNQVKVTKETSN